MATITKISAQKRKGRYNIFLDEQYAFPVSESVLIQFRLAKGLEIDAQLQAKITAAEAKAQSYQLALNYLAHQLRSEMEVRRYLKQHDVTYPVRQQVIERLHQLKLVDDANYAASYVRTMKRTSDKGPIVIQKKLQEKGIAPELILNALDLYSDGALLANGLKAAQKLAHRYRRLSFRQQQQKIRLGLRQKGYPQDLVSQLLDRLDLQKDDATEWQALVQQGRKAWRKNARYSDKQRRQKTKQQLYRKGFALLQIDRFLAEQPVETEKAGND
uniref:Regulatory protein RecX n=1 Tax=Loigolactobacillus rennini TaxID=238013 RepID=A0A1K2I4Z5_9LACO|nr:regulatory protein RecX [Loigolactobacillus rennini]